MIWLKPSFLLASLALFLHMACVDSAFEQCAHANPSVSSPDGYLDIHAVVPVTEELGGECIKLFESFRELVIELEKKVDPKKFSAAYVASQRFARLNVRLKNLGEPLSFDLRTRYVEWSSRYYRIRTKFIPSQECAAIANKVTVELRKKEKPRQKLLDQIRQLNEKKDWEAAESLWDKSMASFWQQLAFLDGQPLAEFNNPFGLLEEVFGPEREKERSSLFLNAVIEKHQGNQQARDSFFAMIKEAPGQIASSGRVTVGADAISGGSALRQFVLDFGPLHVDLMRDAALDFLSMATTAKQQSSNVSLGTDNLPVTFWRKNSAAATQELRDAILAILNADAQGSAPLAQVEYVEYLKSTAMALHRLSSQTSEQDFASSLDLVAKRAGLEKTVAAYREATKDVLGWRLQIAERLSKKQVEKEFPALDDFVRNYSINGPEGVSRMSETARTLPIPTMTDPNLSQPLSKSIPADWALLRGKMVSVGEVARFDSEKELLMSRLINGMYARPLAGLTSLESIAQLKKELIVDETHPALDLTAALAIHQAESGEVMNCGGELVGMNIESACTRMLKMPSIAGSFLRYSAIQSQANPKDEMAGLFFRFDLKPKWIATSYQFVMLP